MAHGLRGFGLLLIAGAVGCTAPEKIAPQRLQLPPPQLPPASPTAASKPASPVPDLRGQPRPIATSAPTSDGPMFGQGPAVSPPSVTPPGPATMPLSPADSKVPGRGTPVIPSPAPPSGVNPIYTPTGLSNPVPPDMIPTPAPPPPLVGKPIEVVPSLPASPVK